MGQVLQFARNASSVWLSWRTACSVWVKSFHTTRKLVKRLFQHTAGRLASFDWQVNAVLLVKLNIIIVLSSSFWSHLAQLLLYFPVKSTSDGRGHFAECISFSRLILSSSKEEKFYQSKNLSKKKSLVASEFRKLDDWSFWLIGKSAKSVSKVSEVCWRTFKKRQASRIGWFDWID